MTEEEAREWLATHFPACAIDKLERFVAILTAEAERQSLIARSTFDLIWSRHIADSAQLVSLAPESGVWLDIGSGGGLPGLVVAILRDDTIILCEPRRKRADFLEVVRAELGLSHAKVRADRVQQLVTSADIVSARAVAPIEDLFAWTRHNVSRETRYLLPRGQNAASDLAIAARAWHGRFHVEQSITDPDSGIVVAHQVAAR